MITLPTVHRFWQYRQHLSIYHLTLSHYNAQQYSYPYSTPLSNQVIATNCTISSCQYSYLFRLVLSLLTLPQYRSLPINFRSYRYCYSWSTVYNAIFHFFVSQLAGGGEHTQRSRNANLVIHSIFINVFFLDDYYATLSHPKQFLSSSKRNWILKCTVHHTPNNSKLITKTTNTVLISFIVQNYYALPIPTDLTVTTPNSGATNTVKYTNIENI
jgi:hypothetical protein